MGIFEFIFEAIKFLLWDWWTNILLDIAFFIGGDKKNNRKNNK